MWCLATVLFFADGWERECTITLKLNTAMITYMRKFVKCMQKSYQLSVVSYQLRVKSQESEIQPTTTAVSGQQSVGEVRNLASEKSSLKLPEAECCFS